MSVPFDVPVAMQSSPKGRTWQTRRSAFCAAQSCRHETEFVVPCCQHALYLECLVRSFESCGVRCPFCQIDLSTLASSPKFQQLLGRRVEFDQPIPDPIQPVVPPRSIWHVGMDDQFRSLFCQELVASVKHTQRTLPGTPIVVWAVSQKPHCACHARRWSCARHVFISEECVTFYCSPRRWLLLSQPILLPSARI